MLNPDVFEDRVEPLRFLEKKYNSDEFECIIIYGRRRIGKTELIKKFISDKNHIYHLVTQEERNIQLRRIAESVFKKYGDFKPKIENYHDLFKYFTKVVDEKTVFILDEFPYLIEQDKSIPSLFQTFIDEYLSSKNMVLILCGSSISMMESMLTARSPLYGRRTGQIELHAFTFKETRKMLSNKCLKNQIEHYAVFGGTPFYLQMINQKLSLQENIRDKICNDKEVLHEEPWMLLKQEFNKPHRYMSILEAIADGCNTPKKIADRLPIPQQSVPKYLGELERIRLLDHIIPVTERNKKSRKGLYKLSDNFFDFWFKFIAPNMSDVKENPHDFVNNFVVPYFGSYVGRIFEDVCSEFVRELSRNDKLSSRYVQVGSWWHREKEIDIVGLNKRKPAVVFGECKWSKNKVSMKTFKILKNKSEYVRWENENRKQEYILFSKSGFTKRLQDESKQNLNLHLYSLEEMDKVFKKTV